MRACSNWTVVFAYLALTYLLASIMYVVFVRCLRVGTPFKDSLTEEQRRICRRSRSTRGSIFVAGVVVAAIALAIARPFRQRVEQY